MEDPTHNDEPAPELLAGLSALADGTLAPERAAKLWPQISSSPQLNERYERELRAVEVLAVVQADRAPARLRARIEAERRPRSRLAVPRLGTAWGMAVVGALAVAAVAMALLLPAGAPGGPSVSEAASLALRGSVLPAPRPRGPGATLNQDVQEVYFPDWSHRFGWRAVGQRIDKLGGRSAVTVYYDRDGRRIAYTIVATPALSVPRAGTHYRNGIEFRSFSMGERQVVTWHRAGHTCVLSGVGVPVAQLWRLAAWSLPARAAA